MMRCGRRWRCPVFSLRQNSAIAKNQQEMIELNREIQSERKELNQGFKQLESDRRELHQQRRSELAWAESFQFLAIVIAASMPLFLCAYLIWASTRNVGDSDLINEVLIQELVATKPRLIAGRNRSIVSEEPKLPAIESNRKSKTKQDKEKN